MLSSLRSSDTAVFPFVSSLSTVFASLPPEEDRKSTDEVFHFSCSLELSPYLCAFAPMSGMRALFSFRNHFSMPVRRILFCISSNRITLLFLWLRTSLSPKTESGCVVSSDPTEGPQVESSILHLRSRLIFDSHSPFYYVLGYKVAQTRRNSIQLLSIGSLGPDYLKMYARLTTVSEIKKFHCEAKQRCHRW